MPQWLHDCSGLSEITAEALLQVETRPRCVPADDGLMVFLRGVNLNPGADPTAFGLSELGEN